MDYDVIDFFWVKLVIRLFFSVPLKMFRIFFQQSQKKSSKNGGIMKSHSGLLQNLLMHGCKSIQMDEQFDPNFQIKKWFLFQFWWQFITREQNWMNFKADSWFYFLFFSTILLAIKFLLSLFPKKNFKFLSFIVRFYNKNHQNFNNCLNNRAFFSLPFSSKRKFTMNKTFARKTFSLCNENFQMKFMWYAEKEK